MSGEAVRDVTVRVGVQGGKIDKWPDFKAATTAAEGFLQTVESGMKILQHDAGLAVEAVGRLTTGLREAASEDFGDLGLGDARDAVEELAEAHAAAAEAAVEAANVQQEAAQQVETAAEQEGNTAAEVMFKKIWLQERLAAHHRQTAEDRKKAEKELLEQVVKTGNEQQKQMFEASGAIAQALAAGTQFVSTIRLIAGESAEIEELATQFAHMQAVIQAVSAGASGFKAVNEGLSKLQAASAAATATLTATGGAATFTQTALIRLAPAAATAQAALGPIAVAIAGISLAIAAVKAASDYFSEELPDDSDKNAKAFERVTRELDKMKRQIDSNAKSMEAQNNMLRTELDLRKQLAGTTTTSQDVAEGFGNDVKAATDKAAAAVQAQQQEAQKRVAALQDERKRLSTEYEKLVQQDQADKGFWGGDGKNTQREEQKRDIQRRLSEITPQVLSEASAAEGLGVQLTPATMDEYAQAIAQLPQEQQGVFQAILDEYQQSLAASVKTATSDLESLLSDNSRSLDENKRSVDDARKAFEEQQNIALRLQSGEERRKLEESVNSAASPGNLNAGIDAISGVVTTEREQELRNMLAEGNLTREKLLEEIADAAEFETEKKELEQQVELLKQQADALQATREELTRTQQQVKQQMQLLHEEVRRTQQAQQQR